ncbi:MAG: hypothetical protein Q9187_001428 [Circinaria calcarea]
MKTATLIGSTSLSLPPNSYIYDIVAVGGQLGVISSDDSLRIFDPQTLQPTSDGIRCNVHEGVTCLERNRCDNSTVLTAGRDGKIRCWDIRAAETTFELGSGILDLPDNQWFSYARLYHSAHDLHYQLAFHPTKSSCLLSGSTDGLVNIYDINITDEEDALSRVINHGASVGHAGFLSDTEIYALSHDEMLSIYHLNLANDSIDDHYDPPPIMFGDLRPKASCEYIVDVDVLSFGEGAVLGAGTHSQHRLDLIALNSASGWAIDESQTIRLAGAHGEDIVRSFYIDSQVCD